MCVGSAMPVATLPVTEWGNRSTRIVLCESDKRVVDRHRFIVQYLHEGCFGIVYAH